MPHYRYKAKKSPEETVEDVLEAESQELAIEMLTQAGLTPIRIEPDNSSRETVVLLENPSLYSRKIKLRDVTLFSTQLARLIKAGVPILKALGMIREETDNRYLKRIIGITVDDIKSGNTLSKSLQRFSSVFPSFYIAIVRAGEDSGTLQQSLERISEYLNKQEELRSKIRLALIYPCFMALVGMVTISFMLIFVIPRISGIYQSSGKELPMVTKVLIAISDGLKNNWLWIILFVAISFVSIKQFSRRNKELVSALKLKIPFYGNLVLKSEIARMAECMQLSLKSGIQILRAIEFVLPIIDNEIIRKDMSLAHERIKQGDSFGKNIKRSKIFPVFVGNLITIGEETGRLDEMLAQIAEYFQKDTDEALKIFLSQFEPLMILIIGLILGYIVIAMLLPILQLNLMVS